MVEVVEQCYLASDIESDDDPENFTETDVQRLERNFDRTEINELDYGGYEIGRPAPPFGRGGSGSTIPFIDDDRANPPHRVPPPRPPPPRASGGEKKKKGKNRYSFIKNAFDGFNDGKDLLDIMKHIKQKTGEKGMRHNWSDEKVQKLAEKMISRAAHRFLKVDIHTGHIIGSIAGNLIFHTGGRDNQLGNIGKVVLDNMVSGKFRKKCAPFRHTVDRPGVQSFGLDFYKERDRCLRDKVLFEDPEFPASGKSLYYRTPPRGLIQWRRPAEIVKDPQLIVEGHSRFDVKQGKLGDCWLLAGVANVTLRDELFYRVVPPDQSFTENYAGIFHFQFWRYGRWVDVVIDDRLPTQNGQLIYMSSDTNNEFWSALLEKAYAKMYGCYECLDGGLTVEALEDMTGGLSEHFDLRKMDQATVLAMLVRGFQMGSLFACSLDADPNVYEAVMPNGLVRGHAYSLTGVQTVNTYKGDVLLVRLRNPWGNNKEWYGAWSDGSSEWLGLSNVEKTRLEINFKGDGEFWMSFNDFYYTFEVMEICNLSANVMNEIEDMTGVDKKEINDVGIWRETQCDGSWSMEKDTSGGCINYITSFPKNPQFRMNLTLSGRNVEEDGNCTVIVAVMQKFRRELRAEGKDNLPIGFSVYKAPPALSGKLDERFFRTNRSVARSPVFMNLREVTARFRVPPGEYIIVPSTFEPYHSGDFLIRIYANCEVQCSPI